MLCVNAPRKPMARIHMLISLILVIVCTVLAFTPLIKVVVTQETVDAIENLVGYIVKQDGESESEADAAIQKVIDSMNLEGASVELSIMGMSSSSQVITDASQALSDFIAAAIKESSNGSNEDAAKEDDEEVAEASAEESEEELDEESSEASSKSKEMSMEEAAKKLRDVFLTEDGEVRPEARDLVVVVAALVGPMIPSVDEVESGMNEDDMPALLARAIPHIIGLVIAVILSLLIPVIYAILALATLITTLRYLKDPVIGSAKVARRMPKSVVHPLTIILITCLSATLAYTKATLILAILAGVGTFVNVIFTRLHSWEKEDIAYANAVQAISLLSIGAYIYLFLQILKMGVFKSFIGKLINFFMNSESSASGSNAYLDIAMILIAVFFALFSTKYLAKVARRVSLASKPKKKGSARACHLVNALFLLLITVFPMMALGSTANNGRPFLAVTVEQEYALFYGFIATAAMVFTEILLLIFRKALNKGMSPGQIADILTNVAEGPAPLAVTDEIPVAEEPATDPVEAESEKAPSLDEAALFDDDKTASSLLPDPADEPIEKK